MLAHQQRRIGSIRTPTKRPLKKHLVLKPRQIRRDRPPNRLLRSVGIRIRRVLRVRARDRDGLGRARAVRLVLLVPREARELVADFDDAVLVGLEEKADVAVVDDRDAGVLGRFGGRELDVRVYPGLKKALVRGAEPWDHMRVLLPWNSTGLPDLLESDSMHRLRERPCR